jgi:hypothetical protein
MRREPEPEPDKKVGRGLAREEDSELRFGERTGPGSRAPVKRDFGSGTTLHSTVPLISETR